MESQMRLKTNDELIQDAYRAGYVEGYTNSNPCNWRYETKELIEACKKGYDAGNEDYYKGLDE